MLLSFCLFFFVSSFAAAVYFFFSIFLKCISLFSYFLKKRLGVIQFLKNSLAEKRNPNGGVTGNTNNLFVDILLELALFVQFCLENFIKTSLAFQLGQSIQEWTK